MISYKNELSSRNSRTEKLLTRGVIDDGEETKPKVKIEGNDNILNCIENIVVAYKGGNTVKLSNLLNYMNSITTDYFFDPILLINNEIPKILIQIAFDRSNIYSHKCTLLALSIIENLTFDEEYGYYEIFQRLNILNSSCLSILSNDIGIVTSSLKILTNLAWMHSSIAHSILSTIPLEEFLNFLVSFPLENNNGNLKAIKYLHHHTASLLYVLSFSDIKKYASCFYVAVDFLLKSEIPNTDIYILWIVMNCAEAENYITEQLLENANLMKLLCFSLSNNDIYRIKPTFFILEKLICGDFNFLPDLNFVAIFNILQNENDDEIISSILMLMQKYSEKLQFIQIVNESPLVSILSQKFNQCGFVIQNKIIKVLCNVLKYAPISTLSLLISEHIVFMLIHSLQTDDLDFLFCLLSSISHILESISLLNSEIFLSFMTEFEIDEIEQCDHSRNDICLLISNIKTAYDNITNSDVAH